MASTIIPTLQTTLLNSSGEEIYKTHNYLKCFLLIEGEDRIYLPEMMEEGKITMDTMELFKEKIEYWYEELDWENFGDEDEDENPMKLMEKMIKMIEEDPNHYIILKEWEEEDVILNEW